MKLIHLILQFISSKINANKKFKNNYFSRFQQVNLVASLTGQFQVFFVEKRSFK